MLAKSYPYYLCPNGKCNAINLRKEQLEEKFSALLARLRPTPGYLKLFHEIVLDVWKAKQK